jgi:hypothetical protein
MFASATEWIWNYIIREVSVIDCRSPFLIQCGVETRLCSIKLNNPAFEFTNWHKNKTHIIREGEEEFREDEWAMCIKIHENASGKLGNVLDIFCRATQPGRATVKLDLGRWYKFVNKSEFLISVESPLSPVSPVCDNNVGNVQFRNKIIKASWLNQETVTSKPELPDETVIKDERQDEKEKCSADSYQNNNISDKCHSPNFPYVEWIPEFDGLTEKPLFPGDDHFKCLIHLGSQSSPKLLSANDLTVFNYKKQIIADVKILRPGVIQAIIPLKDINVGNGDKAHFTFHTPRENVLPLDISFTVYQKFDKESCKYIHRNDQERFQCKNILASDIKGEDRCYLNNIERVCCVENDGRKQAIRVEPINSNVGLILPELCDEIKCQKILLHLLRAIYYRKKASETDKERIKWKEKAMETYAANNRKHSSFCKHIKTKYADLMQQYNDEASKEIFAFFNEERGLNHVDLHGLLVVNEETLARDKEQLLKDNPEEEVITIINKRRNQGDEAVRKLKGKIDEFMEKMEKAQSEKKTWLEVIVGAGHHSMAGRQKIRPKVETFLQDKYPGKISVVNEGSLVVTFEEYPNGGRCFGHYYCQTCKKSWRSGQSFKNKWQGCFKCYDEGKGIKKCLPVMQQPLQKSEQRGGAGARKYRHLKQLCQVCEEGGSCTT